MRRAVGLAGAGLLVVLSVATAQAHQPSRTLRVTHECAELTGRDIAHYTGPIPVPDEAKDPGLSFDDRVTRLRLWSIDPGYTETVLAGPDHLVFYTASPDETRVRTALGRAGLTSDVTIVHVPYSECELQLASAHASHLLDGWPHGGTLDLVRGEILLRPADPGTRPRPSPAVVARYQEAVAPIRVVWNSPRANIYEAQ